MKALIIGCGNFGKRWLDAIENSVLITSIYVVDPKAISELTYHPRITFFSSAKDLSFNNHYDLIVNCVNADQRANVMLECKEKHISCDRLVLEKVLAQSLQALSTFSDLNISKDTYVNYNMRYQAVVPHILSAKSFDVDLGSFDLASNIFHYVDLAEQLFASSLLNINLSNLSLRWLPSRKRTGFKTVAGTIVARLKNGVNFTLKSIGSQMPKLSISTEGGIIFEINENDLSVQIKRLADETLIDTTFKWCHFSSLSSHILEDLLTNQSKLPRLNDVYHHTHIILEAFLIHYEQSINANRSNQDLFISQFPNLVLPIT